MALLKCPDCGKPVSDKAEKCVSCGCPISALLNPVTPETVSCSECKKDYPFDANNCPHCGCFNGKKRNLLRPLEEYKEGNNYVGDNELKSKKKNSSGLLKVVFITVVMFFVVFFAGIVFTSMKPTHTDVPTIKRTPEQLVAQLKLDKEKVKLQNEQKLKNDIQSMCHHAVIRSLHDPDSSDMGFYKEHYFKKLKNNEYLVLVTGKAKNGFNALRKLAVGCKVKAKPDQDIQIISMAEVK